MIALYKVNKYPMIENKPIYHARNANRWKSLGETSTFHRFTNPRRDKSVYFWSWDTYLQYIWSLVYYVLRVCSLCDIFLKDFVSRITTLWNGVFPSRLLPFRLLPFCLLPFCLLPFRLLSNFTSFPFRLHVIFVLYLPLTELWLTCNNLHSCRTFFSDGKICCTCFWWNYGNTGSYVNWHILRV